MRVLVCVQMGGALARSRGAPESCTDFAGLLHVSRRVRLYKQALANAYYHLPALRTSMHLQRYPYVLARHIYVDSTYLYVPGVINYEVLRQPFLPPGALYSSLWYHTIRRRRFSEGNLEQRRA